MGFKKIERPTYEQIKRLPLNKALAAHKQPIADGARCQECALFGLKLGPITPAVHPDSKLLIISEYPTYDEIDNHEPWSGRAGEEVEECLKEGGVALEDASTTYATLCRYPEEQKLFERRLRVLNDVACMKAQKEGAPEPALLLPHEACAPRLKKDIATAGAPVVLALGDAALTAVAHNWDIPMGAARKVQAGQLRIASLKQQQGSPITLPDGTIAVASYHPNFGFTKGSRHYLQVIREFILRAARIAVRGYIDWKEPDYILSPSVEVIEATLERMWQSDSPITIDLETDKGTREDGEFDPFSCRIRCIGFGAVLDGEEVVICVPIRRIDGTDWWSAENKQRVLRACMNALNSNELVGHNLNFDTQVLLRVGLIAKENERRTFDDTMLMHRNTPHCDLPHGLGFVSAAYFEVPSWKGAADDKYYENVTDYDLQLYNVKDVCNTMRLHMRLQEELLRWNTTKQYAVDKALAPVVRDMGNRLGLFIDEEKRGQFLLDMSSKAFESLRRLKTIVGDPKFNPSSPHQVRKYLFVDKGLTPQINTDMKAWKKGEDPATGVQALMKLASSSSVPEDVKDFIETLLEYRQFMKLKGTYLEKLRVSYPDWKKEFGIDVPMMPEVKGQVWREYTTSERIALMPEDVQSVWKGISREEQKRMLTMVPEGKWEEYIALPERPKVSRLFITYKQHIVSSGRLSSSPNAQNYPKFGKVNTHEMFIAPPGHVMVGADFDQVELRVYAAVANDKLLRDAYTKPGPDGKPFDPHSLNAASMFSKKFGMTIEQAYLYIVGLPEKQKKKLRGYAKTFCIAEGQNVLTLRGEVPIETVRIDDLLWDGVEWVRHDGVVCMGTKPVIQWDGLTATPEHEVWTDSHGKIRFDQAKEGKVLLSRTSAGGRPVRYSDSCGKTMESGNPLAGSRKVPPMSRAERMRLRKQQRALHAWKSSMDDTPKKQSQQKRYSSSRGLRLQTRRMAIPITRGEKEIETGHDTNGHDCRGAGNGKDARYKMANDQTHARVYDIINAGPRHRFTVEGRLVSNCFLVLYGGAAEKLYEFMKAARDKGTGKLVFPDLKEEDVMEWYEAWQKYHPETKAFQDLIEALAKREGYTAASLGAQRKRFFPGGANKPGATYNHKIQATAAELANAALLQIAKNIPYGQWSQFSGPCLQVHDALCVYVPKDRAEEAKKIIETAMNTSIFGIPITATSGVSDSLAGQ